MGDDFKKIDEVNRLVYGWMPGVDAVYSGRDISDGNYISAAIGVLASGAGKEVSQLKKILPGWKKVSIDLEHIASGHIKGGSRVSSIKTLFPEGVNANDVGIAIRDAYRNVHSKLQTQGDRILLRGASSRGLEIEMWLNKATSTIETAYPIY
jgi:hypothetical protein